ncbi:hypothetical protein Xmau_03853 [Xenorhabdus mauleonii]|uniref:TraX protein n=1 Tax=Xenorhabdus mauleonii TaxID=351675 RepID=A0A1I3V452_9GAMM|nr:conjugal transfer protein TraX [Xenorhabdus mauleonii]PHM37635.1 hypothetical protein Xmau_03853 [Xenorhabdus mauleonii]SFJ90424.1 hypothetical protein SAMN05421680_11957 [Xenorhabdus mauleonii]
MIDKNEKKTINWRRRTVKSAYFISNVFLPLSEVRYTASKIGPSLLKNIKRVKYLRPSFQLNRKLQQPILSFDEAVIASSMTIETLKQCFLRRKKLCLSLATIPPLLAISIIFVVLFNGIYTPLLLIKTLVLTLALLSLAALPFFQALICSWRLWQLSQRRASPIERGGLSDFLAENSWIKTTLSLRQ